MSEEYLIKQEDIDKLKARDARWRSVDLAIKVDEELRESPTVNLILEAIARRSTDAMERLLEVDPTESGKISSLQEQVKYAKFIGDNLKSVRAQGLVAQRSLEEEGNVDLEPPNDGSER